MNRNIIESTWVKVALIVILAVGTGCSPKHMDGINSSASISPDDSLICYFNTKGETDSIYIVNKTWAKVGEIPIPNDQSPINPIFSPDGKKILYVSGLKNSESPQRTIYLADINSNSTKCLTPGKENITEAIFSPDGKTIYFLNAGSYGHYSPIAQSHSHDFDVYSIDTTGNNLKQWTDLKAYGLSDLSISKDGKNLFFVQMGDTNTLFTMPLSGDSKPVSVVSGLWDASVSPDNKEIAFSQMKQVNGVFTYDLYLRNFNFQKMSYSDPKQLTFLNTSVLGFNFFNQRPAVLFIQAKNWPDNPQQLQLMEVNLDGTDLKKIVLPN